MLTKATLVCVFIMLAETVHGAFGLYKLNSRLGDWQARHIGVFTDSLIFIAIAWLTMPWIV